MDSLKAGEMNGFLKRIADALELMNELTREDVVKKDEAYEIQRRAARIQQLVLGVDPDISDEDMEIMKDINAVRQKEALEMAMAEIKRKVDEDKGEKKDPAFQ